MGAWIETSTDGAPVSLPKVAPFMGAWIETCPDSNNTGAAGVAPFMGAWIETDMQTLPS